MTYEEAIDFLYNATPQFQQIGAAAYKPGLDTTIKLDNAFGNPHKSFKSIHIGGTNGKGSTSHTLASILMEQGYKVGLYTSPHLIDFRERIRVNGEMISKESVIDFLQRYLKMNVGLKTSFFELTTIMAFDYFKSQNVDYAVIEVGLGGRLDCTNIITPVLSVITNISKDHVAQLGNTLESIAKEKAGIIKPGIPVVIGEADGSIKEIFSNKAAEQRAPIYFAQEDKNLICEYAVSSDSISYKTVYGNVNSPLCGICQLKNTNTILKAVKTLKSCNLEIKPEAIIKGFEKVICNTHLMGRWMKILQKPTIIADTGHNIGGWEYISEQLNNISQKTNLKMIIGFVSDKDVDSIMHLMPRNASYFITHASVKRAMPTSILAEKFRNSGISCKVFESVKEAIEQAQKESSENDVIFIGGSTFIVADALQVFQN
ncbi:MAG: bifunctional folylpolyglutamate synthase/dihydrofolate synthase [Muribaculaceae bacterium]